MYNPSNMLAGNLLSPKDQKTVLAKYVNRYTKDHKPQWAYELCPDGTKYPVGFESDKEWLEHSLFLTTSKGRLDNRAKWCESHPTWPDNPELRRK